MTVDRRDGAYVNFWMYSEITSRVHAGVHFVVTSWYKWLYIQWCIGCCEEQGRYTLRTSECTSECIRSCTLPCTKRGAMQRKLHCTLPCTKLGCRTGNGHVRFEVHCRCMTLRTVCTTMYVNMYSKLRHVCNAMCRKRYGERYRPRTPRVHRKNQDARMMCLEVPPHFRLYKEHHGRYIRCIMQLLYNCCTTEAC